MSAEELRRAAWLNERYGFLRATPSDNVAEQIEWLNSVSCCGRPPEDVAWRADDPRWQQRVPRSIQRMPATARQRLADRLVDIWFCDGCLGLRFGPRHLFRRWLFGIRCGEAS